MCEHTKARGKYMGTLDILESLVERLDGPQLHELNVIPWAAPVISFGNLSHSRIATLGLNPSNREFVDNSGLELDGHERRFHTLRSLGIKRWSQINGDHLKLILDSCNNYFEGNPYDTWFQSLNKLLAGVNATYYGMFSDACHLDLVPYATACKWVELNTAQRVLLLQLAGDALGILLRDSVVDVLVLNGQSVIENFQIIGDTKFKKKAVAKWTLPRKDSRGVTGYAYTGTVSRVSGIDLGREVSILGYSHNIQSSFGVTTQVRDSIQKWIARNTNEVFC
jgi:hypothetical protein